MKTPQQTVAAMIESQAAEDAKLKAACQLFESLGGNTPGSAGKDKLVKLIREVDFEELAECIKIALATYYSTAGALGRLGAIVASRKAERENPAAAKMLHLANILRASWRKRGCWYDEYREEILASLEASAAAHDPSAIFAKLSGCRSMLHFREGLREFPAAKVALN